MKNEAYVVKHYKTLGLKSNLFLPPHFRSFYTSTTIICFFCIFLLVKVGHIRCLHLERVNFGSCDPLVPLAVAAHPLQWQPPAATDVLGTPVTLSTKTALCQVCV